MKAVRVVKHGDPAEALEVSDVPIPEPGPGEVRIAVSAASVNFGDIARCRGTVASVMGQIPFTLGMDVCGVVDAAGEGADEWVGRRVVAMTNQSLGGMAEFARRTGYRNLRRTNRSRRCLRRRLHAAVPRRLPGAAPTREATARARRLLVVGGASAVGTAVIQLGVAAGADVIAVAGGAEKGRLCEELGASFIDHTSADLFDEVIAAHRQTGRRRRRRPGRR